MTLGEVVAVIRAHRARAKAQHREGISVAWHTAVLSRYRRIPPLRSLFKRDPKRLSRAELDDRRETFEEIKTEMGVEDGDA